MVTPTLQRQEEVSPTPLLFLALDLGLKTWKLGFARDFSDSPWVREIAGIDRQAPHPAAAFRRLR
jgi:hypothetical protein